MNNASSTSSHPGNFAHELIALDAEYWACADARSSGSAAGLFVPEGELLIANMRITGHDAIRKFFAERTGHHAATGRFTRHISGNVQIRMVDAQHAELRSTVVMYAGTGPLPAPAGAPTTIADIDDLCRRAEDGEWRFVRRAIIPTFLGDGTAPFTRS